MKYFVVFALCVAATSAFLRPPVIAGDNADQIQEIINAIQHPSTDPATAAALEQMLLDILGVKPEGESPVHILPALIDESIFSEPEVSPAQTLPAFIDPSIVSDSASSPLVQIIINVNPNAPGNPVVVEQPEIVPTPVIVVDKPELPNEEVIIAPVIVPEKPVIVAPIETLPVINLPGTLN